LPGRIEVHAIEVTASVRDANGRVPRDLTPADFVVLENGAPQKVIGVDYTQTSMPSHDRAVHDGQVVIFIQQSLSSTNGLRKALESLASEAESAVAAGAVEAVTDYPGPHSLFGPTSDPIALRGFLQKLANEIAGQEELVRLRTAFAATDLPSDDAPAIKAMSRKDQMRMRARQESTTLRTREDALLGWLSRYPTGTAGSLRTLVLVSDGFDLEPVSFYRLLELRPLSAAAHHEQIARALAGERWTVISLTTPEPSHVTSPSKFQSRIAPSIETTAPSKGIPPLQMVNRFPLAPLTRLADATGGDVITDVENTGAKLRELGDRVVITYQTNQPPDDTLRQIEVTSRRPGLTIRAPKWAGNVTAIVP
jgi:VWFA-related protein